MDGSTLHPRLEAVLRSVQAAERTASGPNRRPTFRLMRELLGGSVRAGVPAHLLAECLGTSTAAVTTRASGADGLITADLIRQLTDLTPRQLERLSQHELTRDGGPGDHEAYSTAEFIRAVLKTPVRTT